MKTLQETWEGICEEKMEILNPKFRRKAYAEMEPIFLGCRLWLMPEKFIGYPEDGMGKGGSVAGCEGRRQREWLIVPSDKGQARPERNGQWVWQLRGRVADTLTFIQPLGCCVILNNECLFSN